MRWFKGVVMCIGLLLMLVSLQAQDNAFVIITPETVDRLELIHTLQLTESYANQIVFNPKDSSQLAAAQRSGIISLWNVSTGEQIRQEREAYLTQGIAYTDDGTQLVIISGDQVNVRNLETFSLEQQLFAPFVEDSNTPTVIDTGPNRLVAIGYENGAVRLFRSDLDTSLMTLPGYTSHTPVRALDISPDGTRLAVASSLVFQYHIENKDIEAEEIYLEEMILTSYIEPINDVAFNPKPEISFSNGVGLVTLTSHVGVQVWSRLHMDSIDFQTTPVYMSYPASMAFNSTGEFLAISGIENATAGCSEENPCHTEILYRSLNAQDKNDPSAQIEQRIVADLAGHDSMITDVVFSPDDRFLATSSMDGTIMIWGIPQP